MEWKLDPEFTEEAAAPPYAVAYNALCAYVYYFRLDANGTIAESRAHYHYQIDLAPSTLGDVKNVITSFAINTFRNGHYPAAHGTRIADLVWRRRGFVVLVVDSDTHSVNPNNPLTIVGSDGNNNGLHTFEDITHMRPELTAPDGVTKKELDIVFAYNQMQDTTHGPIGIGRTENFQLTLNIPGINPITAAGVPGSGGTNMGPPVPPPA